LSSRATEFGQKILDLIKVTIRLDFQHFLDFYVLNDITMITGASTVNNIWIKLPLIAAKNISLRQRESETNPSIAEWAIFLSNSAAEEEILSHTGEELILGSTGPLGKR